MPLRRVLVMALALWGVAPPLAAQRVARRPEVVSLAFTGVHHVSRDELAVGLATRATSCRNVLLWPLCKVSAGRLFTAHRFLDSTELARDGLRIRVFYWKRGWRHARVATTVTADRDSDEVHVRFAVTEGPLTRIASLALDQTDSVLPTATLRRLLLVHEGGPLNLVALDSSVTLLRNRLGDEGYVDAVIADTMVVDTAAHAAAVRIRIAPRWRARVAAIDVHGNTTIPTATIDHILAFRVGDVYRRRDVLQSQRNLYQSNLFRRAVLATPPGQGPAKTVDLTVEQAPLHAVQLRGGFNTVDFGQVEARYTDYDWLGNARQLSANVVVSNLLAPRLNGTGIFQNVTGNLGAADAAPYLRPNYQASLEVTQRWFRDSRNTVGIGVFAHRQSAPAIFIDQGYGANLSFTREVAPRTPLSIVYHYELTSVSAGSVYFCVDYGVCERTTIDALRGTHALSPLSVDLYRDRTNDPLEPTSGYTARIDLQHASAFTASDFRYDRVDAEATRYLTVGRGVLAGRLHLGWVHALASTARAIGLATTTGGQILHPRTRFYAGGAQSVRGYGENQLGPRVLTVNPQVLDSLAGCTNATIADGSCDPSPVPSRDFQPRPTGGTSLIEANLEYRYPLGGPFTGAVFVDAALVGQGAFGNIAQSTGAITPGFGIRYRSPVGPIRLDLGIRPTISQRLTVLTEVVDASGTHRIVQLDTKKLYDPVQASGNSVLQHLLSRLALHLSIGEAF